MIFFNLPSFSFMLSDSPILFLAPQDIYSFCWPLLPLKPFFQTLFTHFSVGGYLGEFQLGLLENTAMKFYIRLVMLEGLLWKYQRVLK